MIQVNLIPMARRIARDRARRMRFWLAVGITYGLLLGGGFAAWRAAWAGQIEDVGPDLMKCNAASSGLAKSIALANAQLNDAKQSADVTRMVTHQPDWGILLASLAKLNDDDVVLRRCELSSATVATSMAPPPPPAPVAPTAPGTAAKPIAPPPPKVVVTLHLSGAGRTPMAVSEYVLRLERTGLFEHVELLGTTRDSAMPEGAVSFRVDGILRTGGRSAP